MGKLLLILAIVGAGWYVQNNYDFSGVKESAINAMKQEKTINTVNSGRDRRQQDINDAINR